MIGNEHRIRHKGKIGGKSPGGFAATDDSPAKNTALGSFLPRFIHATRILSLETLNKRTNACRLQEAEKRQKIRQLMLDRGIFSVITHPLLTESQRCQKGLPDNGNA
jgi:hypothetical protein